MGDILLVPQTELLVVVTLTPEQIVLKERELLVQTEQEVIEVVIPELILLSADAPSEVLEVALQGPPGPAGPAGISSSVTDYFVTAAVALSGHTAVVLDASGQALPADPLNAAHGNAVVGLTKGAASAGAQTPIAALGAIEHLGWAFTPDQPVFLGASGMPVQTPPLGAAFLKVLGVAQSATHITVSLQPAIYLT